MLGEESGAGGWSDRIPPSHIPGEKSSGNLENMPTLSSGDVLTSIKHNANSSVTH